MFYLYFPSRSRRKIFFCGTLFDGDATQTSLRTERIFLKDPFFIWQLMQLFRRISISKTGLLRFSHFKLSEKDSAFEIIHLYYGTYTYYVNYIIFTEAPHRKGLS